ncbi:hypothetical protein D3H65_30330 [Paraflavitalea soli]|uniref:Uncharacterized protein n=1 Tax=Paraflavitalea soli TaxID=2315862 RepID=A0A3B7MY58_9BACT|nr:hypothetical protein [Paraflavitalea soli]AXY78030.1 hypothetical protein D3H65_30330 [Paraflavitalea soli]
MNKPDEKKKDLKKDQQQDPENKDTALPPDPETLHKTDPQDNMKGPVSSLMNKINESAEKNEEEEADDKQ